MLLITLYQLCRLESSLYTYIVYTYQCYYLRKFALYCHIFQRLCMRFYYHFRTLCIRAALMLRTIIISNEVVIYYKTYNKYVLIMIYL